MGTYLNGNSLGIKYLPIYLCFNQELHKLIYIYIELLLILLKKSDYPTSCQVLDGSCSLFFIICFYVGVAFTRGGFIITKSCKQLNYLTRKRVTFEWESTHQRRGKKRGTTLQFSYAKGAKPLQYARCPFIKKCLDSPLDLEY